MSYFSICFSFDEVGKVDIRKALDWCRWWERPWVSRVVRHRRIVTLVEADSAQAAIAARFHTHPNLFTDSVFEVMEVESPEQWSDIPDCTFKFFPALIILEFGTGGIEVLAESQLMNFFRFNPKDYLKPMGPLIGGVPLMRA